MNASTDSEWPDFGPAAADGATPQLRRLRELASQRRWEEALPLCEAALRRAPNEPALFEIVGDVRAALAQWEAAARSYLEAIARAPESAILFRKLGEVQRLCGDTDGAAESYRRESELERIAEPQEGAAAAYLELMKDTLTFLLWGASDGALLELDIRRPVVSLARMLRRLALRHRPAPTSVREFGMDWPRHALTMIGKKRLDNIQACVECVLRDGVPGDLIETGVWRGGATIFMRALLRAYDDTRRKVWVADSFRGLPRPDLERYPADRGYDLSVWRSLAVSADEVRENFRRFGLLDEQVIVLEGWFADTLPVAPIERLAVLRLDGDLYQSTMEALVHLYPKLSPGGFVIIDDYSSAPPCRQAVDDFRRAHGIEEEIVRVDWSGAFWRRAASGPAVVGGP